ncbi:MAG: GNAT family N-acetyltransferase [Bryobacterales bacterium]|nr:GNAT family N-acetyltransferase [Bryobacterales bacterium]
MADYEIINDNLREALAAFALVRAGGRAVHLPGLSLVYAGVPYGLFNTALITATLPSDQGCFYDQVDRAEDFFQRYNVPWSVWFCDEMMTPEERRRARVALATRGLRLTMEAPGMIASAVIAADGELPRLHFTRVENPATREHFSRVMSEAFSVPMDMSRDVYCSDTLWTSSMTGWIGYLGHEAVTTAAVVNTPGSIGLYAVATLPRHQRRRYAEAVMRHAIAAASAQLHLGQTVLQSTHAGYPLYVRMGYRPVSRYFVYVK